MKQAFHAVAAALLISMSAGAATAQQNLNAGPQDQVARKMTIVITQIVDLSEGAKLVRYSDNGGKGLNIMDASTFGDAKLMKLIDAADSGHAVTIMVRGNVIVDVL